MSGIIMVEKRELIDRNRLVIRYYIREDLLEGQYSERTRQLHHELLELLEQIKSKYGIPYQVLNFRGSEEDSIYREHFAKRANILAPRIGGSVARELRSRRGNMYVSGTIALVIALVINDQVEWFASSSDPLYDTWRRYDESEPGSKGVLKWILEFGHEAIQQVLTRAPPSKHELLVNKFIQSGMLKGEFRREVPVGTPITVIDKYGTVKHTGTKSIDLVCITPEEDWVLEVEPKLNPTALGQALIYRDLYKLQNPHKRVKAGIVCEYADQELFQICSRYVDKIFVLGRVTQKFVIDWRG